MSRVLIVGAGLTGSVCACLLRRELQNKVTIEVWDKARGAGGRMSTSRPPHPDCLSADLGAQYVTATPSYAQSHSSFYSELLSVGVLKPLDTQIIEGLQQKEGNSDFMTPLGMSSIVKHFLTQSGAAVFLGRHVTGLRRSGASWEVTHTHTPTAAEDAHAHTHTHTETFDAVVLTMPVPQILKLQGDIEQSLSPHQKQLLEGVEYSSRFAAALFFPPDAILDSFDWSAKYLPGNQTIRYIAADSRKRNADSPGLGPSLVIHSSISFGVGHLERLHDDVQPILMQELDQLLPGLPRPISIKCQKWRYSQVLSAVPGSPGHMTVGSGLLLAGDAFTHSNFDGCIESAQSAAQQLVQMLV